MASLLSSAAPTGYGGPGGSDIPPWVSCMYIWYQSVPAPLPAPPRPGGQLEGPPKAPEGLLLPVEDGSLPWRGVDAFPLCLGAEGRSALAGGGWPSALARSGFLLAPTGGGLTPALLLARGSRGWSLGWRRV